MSTLVNRIVSDSKQTFIIFAIATALIFILYFGVNLDDFDILNAFRILIGISIGVAILSSLIRYSFLLSEKRSIFEYQGVTNKKYNHLFVILSEVFAYIVVDVILLIIYFSFNIELLIQKQPDNAGLLYVASDIYNLLFFKYLITVAIYTIFNISYSVKEYIAAFIIALICILYLYQLATVHFMFNVLYIVIMIGLNMYIYRVKMKQHDNNQLSLVSHAFIMVFVLLFIKDYVFVPIVYDNSFYFIDIGKYSINILPIIILFIWVIYESKRLKEKFFSLKVFIVGLIIPIMIATLALQIINVRVDGITKYFISEEEKNTIFINHNYENFYFSNHSINIKHLNINQRKELLEEIYNNAVYKYNSELLYNVDDQYLFENNLVFINFYDNNQTMNIILDQDNFNDLLEKSGFEKMKVFVEYDSKNDEIKRVILNDDLVDYKQFVEKRLYDYYDVDKLKFEIDNDLYERFAQLNPKELVDSEALYESKDKHILRYSIYIFDNKSVGNDYQYLGTTKSVNKDIKKEGGE